MTQRVLTVNNKMTYKSLAWLSNNSKGSYCFMKLLKRIFMMNSGRTSWGLTWMNQGDLTNLDFEFFFWIWLEDPNGCAWSGSNEPCNFDLNLIMTKWLNQIHRSVIGQFLMKSIMHVIFVSHNTCLKWLLVPLQCVLRNFFSYMSHYFCYSWININDHIIGILFLLLQIPRYGKGI